MVREALFADSMLESSWAQRSRRSLSTLTSFALEAVVVAVLILLSLLKTVVMPAVQTVSTPVFLGRTAPAPRVSPQHGGSTTVVPVDPNAIVLRPRSHPPIGMHQGAEEQSGQPLGEIDSGIYGAESPTGNNFPVSIFSGNHPIPAVPAASKPAVREFRRSSVLEGSLIRRVQPVYPPLARGARIQGPVVLLAVISKAGTIENLRVVSGHPMLVAAAIDAVKEWRYRPYILNNEAIEVETQITVNFYLGGN